MPAELSRLLLVDFSSRPYRLKGGGGYARESVVSIRLENHNQNMVLSLIQSTKAEGISQSHVVQNRALRLPSSESSPPSKKRG